MKCKYDNEMLKLLALAIGTSARTLVPEHHIRYLVQKMEGKDGLSLDSGNQKIYETIKRIIEEVSHGKIN